MFAKLVTLIVVLMLLAVSLLVFRQQRLDLAHDIAAQHRSVQTSRHAIWKRETRVAELLRPSELMPRLESLPVALDTATPDPVRTNTAFVDAGESVGTVE